MKIKLILFAILICVLNTGCGTYVAYNYNKRTAIEDYVKSSNDPAVVKAYNDGDIKGIGIDLSAANVILRNPKAFSMQLLGAGVDAVLLYEIIKELDDNNKVTVTGDGNTVQISGDKNKER